MSLRQLLRKPHFFPSKSPFSRPRRFQSSTPPPDAKASRTQARADKVLNRVPRFLRNYTDGLRNAPVSHVVAFLILHELTAIVPLIGLASYFHYTNWLPPVRHHFFHLPPFPLPLNSNSASIYLYPLHVLELTYNQ
jgi:hypothetical protein